MLDLINLCTLYKFENPEIVSYVQFQIDIDVRPIERFMNGEYNQHRMKKGILFCFLL